MLTGIIQAYEANNYRVAVFRPNPLHCGIPQSRTRVYLLALDA